MFYRRVLSNPGSHVYGLAAIALGLIGLAWGDFATVWQPVPADTPRRVLFAYIVAVCLIAGGAAIQWRRTAQAGVLVLTVLYFMFALLWLPRVVGYPRMIGTWLGFAEQFSLVAAGVTAYTLLAPRPVAWATRTAQACRVLFGTCVVIFGAGAFFSSYGDSRHGAEVDSSWTAVLGGGYRSCSSACRDRHTLGNSRAPCLPVAHCDACWLWRPGVGAFALRQFP